MIASSCVLPPTSTPPVAREDQTWVAAARAGDAAAFRRLVDLHGAAVLAIARRMLRDPHDAEELAQDAFVRAWRALPYFRGDSSFRTWLHRIVVRLAYDKTRQTSARRRREVVVDDGVWDTLLAQDPAAIVAPDADDVRWADLLDTLPAVSRAAIVLFYWNDRSVREVADVLELPEGTVKSHLARARASLRTAYERAQRRASHDEP